MGYNGYAYMKEYTRLNLRKLNFSFNIYKDADILKRLDEVGNKNGYIKRLIREDMKKHADAYADKTAGEKKAIPLPQDG